MGGLTALTESLGFSDRLSGVIYFGLLLASLFSIRAENDPEGCASSGHTLGLKRLALPHFVLLICAVGYVCFLVLSISLFDRATPLDGRILIPVTWMFIILSVLGLSRISEQFPSWKYPIAVFFLLILFARFMFHVVPNAAVWHVDGQDLSRPQILYDKALSWIRESAPGYKRLYSNTPWTVYLATKRHVQPLEAKEVYTTGVANPAYRQSFIEVVAAVDRGDAIMVIDASYNDPFYRPPTVSELEGVGLVPNEAISTPRFLVYGVGSR
jgi:hypothetical protein